MRTSGVPERNITGDASDWDKFAAWAATVPQTLRNPLYHWTHLELKFPFGVSGKLLGPDTAKEIFEHCNRKLAETRVHGAGAAGASTTCSVVCSTDDPVDDLEPHRRHAKNTKARTKLCPTWRPDKALALHDPAGWNEWVDKLAAAADVDVRDLASLREALQKRHDFFHATGCRASDHGLERIYAAPYTEAEAAAAFAAARAGKPLSPEQIEKLRSALCLRLRGDGPQARAGCSSSTSAPCATTARARCASLGPDTGYDAVGDFPQGEALARFLDRLDAEGHLAKTIVYNLNPARQRAADDDHRLVPGRLGAGQDAVRQRLVVPGSARRHGEADERAVQHGPAVALRRHVDRLAQLPVVLAPRLLPPAALQPAGQRRRARAASPTTRALLGRLVEDVCFRNARAATSASRFDSPSPGGSRPRCGKVLIERDRSKRPS